MFYDHYAMNRNLLTGEPDSDIIWTEWDYTLLHVMKSLEQYVDKETGNWVWLEHHPDVRWTIEQRYRRSMAAKEQFESRKGYTRKPGEYLITVPHPSGREELPTYQDWVDWELTRKSSGGDTGFTENGTPMTKFMDKLDALPPIPENLRTDWVNPDLIR